MSLLNQKEEKLFRKWLEEQKDSMNNKSDNLQSNTNTKDISEFSKYYNINGTDLDLSLNDKHTADSIVHMKENLFDYFKTQDDLVYLDKIIEKYKNRTDYVDNLNFVDDDFTWQKQKKKTMIDKLNKKQYNPSNMNILIPPNSNRYEVNNLFKTMVDICDDGEMVYNIPNVEDIKNGKSHISFDMHKLITPDFKDDFYKFCYINSK